MSIDHGLYVDPLIYKSHKIPGTHIIVQTTTAPDGTVMLEVFDPWFNLHPHAIEAYTAIIEAVAELALWARPGENVTWSTGRDAFVSPLTRGDARIAVQRLTRCLAYHTSPDHESWCTGDGVTP